ncbi:FtsX-like permease family protein [Nonomuraea insulae]|uniref:FtsX-like permease family protein n=1 Tax=Nonomuraea insulae TaxID=1616787 RepID=A0ABW1DD51_9ACTN
MLILIWLRGLLTRRAGRLAAAAVGIALAVALPAALGAFLATAKATMTARSVQRVAVDWQVEQQPGQTVSVPMPGTSRQMSFARIDGFESRQAGQTLTTGAGQVLGLPAGYAAVFPGELRLLAGDANGPLLAQQTAANLHAQPGANVTVRRPGLPDAAVAVTGVVELPAADSLFQRVGAPAGAQPQAPPDNVLLLPEADWHRLFDGIPRDRVRTQFHVRVDHRLPPDPAAAYTAVTGQARNLEERMAGSGLVGDNLGAALDAAREDALYSQVLFLFLGAPAVVLAALLVGLVTRAGAPRRVAEQALLRTRGASRGTLVRLALAETALVGVAGVLAGLGLAALAGRALFGSANVSWWAAVLGLLVAVVTMLLPALRATTVAAARRPVGGPRRSPAWLRYGLDLWLLAGSAVIFWITGKSGYQLVLVPEGLPQLSVDYWAFAGPALLWTGAGLLIWRLTRTLPVTWAVRPLAGGLAGTVSAMLTRQRAPLARAATLAALAVAFAVSTSVFDATYLQQAQVDAELTNGADVTVSQTAATQGRLAAVPGVSRVEPLQHRFAYVGSDLQDLYGIRPATTRLRDAYVSGGTAREILDRLTRRPDALLVSQETVNDFQLHLGDQVRLRTEDGRTVPFHYAGVITEFPTAPRDSFLVANASYLARTMPAGTTYLITTDGTRPSQVAAELRGRLGPTARVTDVETTRQVVGSSLTAVDLSGLTVIELGYALVLAAVATGLLLALGFAERRRTYALARVLGATPRQLGSFVWAEVALVGVAAAVLGALCGWALSRMLVAVLSGVFDPPPDALAVPWAYLAVLAVLGVAALLVAGAATVRAARRPPLTVLRDL